MISILESLNKEHFIQMELLEKQFYSSEFITSVEETYEYYKKYPLTTIAAAEDSKLIGFCCMFPVVDNVFNSIMRGTYNDAMLTYKDIEKIEPPYNKTLHMFLSCIVVDKQYHKKGVSKYLLLEQTNNYANIGCNYDYIVTDNVTKAGCRFSEKLGMTFVCKSNHNSSIYAMQFCEFTKLIRCEK